MEVATNALFMTYGIFFECEYDFEKNKSNSISFKLYDIYA
jgi:hypothetical protein